MRRIFKSIVNNKMNKNKLNNYKINNSDYKHKKVF